MHACQAVEVATSSEYPLDWVKICCINIGPGFGFAPVILRELCLLAMVFHCPFQNVIEAVF